VTTALVTGLFVGAVYGLLAVGLVMTYRCSRVINFAYGETGMLGAFVFTELWVDGATPLPVALLAGVGLSAAIGAATEAAVIRPLRDQPRLTSMVATLAVGSLLITYASRRYGISIRFTDPLVRGGWFDIAGVTVRSEQLLIAAVATLALLLIGAAYKFTAFGLRLRAVAIDPYAAGLVGVNSNTTSLLAWGAAGGLAGLSAILIAPSQSFSVFFMTTLLLRSLAAALVGGLTSLAGAFGAGVLLGLAEAFIGYKAPVTGAVEVALALFVIVLLLVRPTGLFRAAY
jgi:branched-chain amino acid transport system permease protein